MMHNLLLVGIMIGLFVGMLGTLLLVWLLQRLFPDPDYTDMFISIGRTQALLEDRSKHTV